MDTPLVVDNLQALLDAGLRFGTVYADPPWRYDNRASRGAAEDHYATLSLDEIAALPVRQLAARQAHLHLWTTNAFLFEARQVMAAWGFRYRSCLVWCKPQLGMGNYWRLSHEFLLLGVRGDLPFRRRGRKSWVVARREAHSSKPDVFRRLVARVSPAARIELFGRKRVPGWTVFGDAVAGHVVEDEGNDLLRAGRQLSRLQRAVLGVLAGDDGPAVPLPVLRDRLAGRVWTRADSTALSRALRRLKQRGLVRRAGALDGGARSDYVVLTEAGERLADAA
jgi:N6-adenosine-specific RNA methylase IME4